MSWIESRPDYFQGYNLTGLKVDQAILNVSTGYNKPLWLYQLSTNCLTCPYKLVREIVLSNGAGRADTISTTFPTKFRIRTEGSQLYVPELDHSHRFCDFSHSFGEFGIYEVRAEGNAENATCQVETILEAVNIYWPLLIAFFVFFLLKLLVWGVRNHETLFPSLSYKNLCQKWRKGRESSASTDTSVSLNLGLEALRNYPPSPSPNSNPHSKSRRLSSLDTFRGICILLMISVHDGGASYNFMQHAAWDGLTVADLILPWFIWIMGVCIPISLKGAYKRKLETKVILRKVTLRAFKLLAIGLFMNTIGGQATDLRYYRFFAILQRLAVGSLVGNLLAILCLKESFKVRDQNYFRRNSTLPRLQPVYAFFKDICLLYKGWLVILALVGVHSCLIFLLEVPGCPTGYLGPGGMHKDAKYPAECMGGATGYVDRKVWGNSHIYRWPTANEVYGAGQEEGQGVAFDPEGTLGYLTTFLQVWAGVQTGLILLLFKDEWEQSQGQSQGLGQGQAVNQGHNKPLALSRPLLPWGMVVRWALWGIVQGVLAGFLCDWKQTGGLIPVNKNLYSLSFVLATNSMAVGMLILLYILVDLLPEKLSFWTWTGSPLKEPGQNSILLYIVHLVVQKMFPWHWAYGQMQSHFIRLAESLWGISLWVCIAMWLVKKKIFLKM